MAIHAMKHRAFKIWAAAAVSAPLTLWLLSHMGDIAGPALPIGLLTALFGAAYAGSGWLGSHLALRFMPSLLHEAGVWERNGDMDRAEQAYQKALAAYDSFLLSPRARRRGIPPLISRMARMYAAQADRQAEADRFMEHYLQAYPTDREIAEAWLQAREYQGELTSRQQELAVRIGDAHAADEAIQMTLARLYLKADRTDFPALQTYGRAMSGSAAAASTLAMDLSVLFIAEGRSDEWALPVYLQAARQHPPSEALRCGLAACLRWILPSDRNAERLARARAILGDIRQEDLVRMSSGFVPPSGSYPARDVASPPAPESGARSGKAVFEQASEFGIRLDRWRQRLQTVLIDGWRRSPELRRGLTLGLIAGLGIVAVALLINTVGYLTPSPAPEAPPPASTPEVAPPRPMPYTLQVAAYLKPEHAERYLEDLKGQAIDAYVTQAYGNGKTWYQVRIAHFPDKAAALAYGSDLKAKGIIEDFYVAKEQGP